MLEASSESLTKVAYVGGNDGFPWDYIRSSVGNAWSIPSLPLHSTSRGIRSMPFPQNVHSTFD